jgi:hypothetical protein
MFAAVKQLARGEVAKVIPGPIDKLRQPMLREMLGPEIRAV